MSDTKEYRLIDADLFKDVYAFLQKKASDGEELKQQADLCYRLRNSGSMQYTALEGSTQAHDRG